MTASGIDEKAGKVKVANFLHVAGVEARRIYNTFNIPEDEAEDSEVLIKNFQDYRYVEPRLKSDIFATHIFHSQPRISGNY